jgi:hypothetical protein
MDDAEAAALQVEILTDPLVQSILTRRQPDGWIGSSFHGTDGMETALRILCEKGVEPGHPVIENALSVLEIAGDRLYRGIGRPGRILDDLNLGGSQMIRAYLFAMAGREEYSFVQEQIQMAVDAFRSILSIHSIDEMADTSHHPPILRSGIVWPGLYHLRLLAWSKSWRTPDNLSMLAECISRMVEFSPLPDYHIKYKGQLIAPASFCMLDFNADLAKMDSAHWMMWFIRMELISRTGIVPYVPALKRQVQQLETLLDEQDGLFTNHVSHPWFTHWSAYTGIMLEKDWKKMDRRMFDLTFRSLLILHYSCQTREAGS